MTFEDFCRRRIDFMGVMSNEDKRRLKEHLKSPVVLKALSWVMLYKEELVGLMANQDFSTPKGIGEAQKLQGMVLGVHNAIERLFAAAEEDENERTESDSGS